MPAGLRVVKHPLGLLRISRSPSAAAAADKAVLSVIIEWVAGGRPTTVSVLISTLLMLTSTPPMRTRDNGVSPSPSSGRTGSCRSALLTVNSFRPVIVAPAYVL